MSPKTNYLYMIYLFTISIIKIHSKFFRSYNIDDFKNILLYNKHYFGY